MNFQNEKISLHLEVVNYQYADAKDECDRNWLRVTAKLSEENKVFETMDPFLQTYDLQYMIKWFESLPNPTYNELDFIEPNLAFEFMGEKQASLTLLFAYRWNLTPHGVRKKNTNFLSV